MGIRSRMIRNHCQALGAIRYIHPIQQDVMFNGVPCAEVRVFLPAPADVVGGVLVQMCLFKSRREPCVQLVAAIMIGAVSVLHIVFRRYFMRITDVGLFREMENRLYPNCGFLRQYADRLGKRHRTYGPLKFQFSADRSLCLHDRLCPLADVGKEAIFPNEETAVFVELPFVFPVHQLHLTAFIHQRINCTAMFQIKTDRINVCFQIGKRSVNPCHASAFFRFNRFHSEALDTKRRQCRPEHQRSGVFGSICKAAFRHVLTGQQPVSVPDPEALRSMRTGYG